MSILAPSRITVALFGGRIVVTVFDVAAFTFESPDGCWNVNASTVVVEVAGFVSDMKIIVTVPPTD